MFIKCTKCDGVYSEDELLASDGWMVCPVCMSNEDLFVVAYHKETNSRKE